MDIKVKKQIKKIKIIMMVLIKGIKKDDQNS